MLVKTDVLEEKALKNGCLLFLTLSSFSFLLIQLFILR